MTQEEREEYNNDSSFVHINKDNDEIVDDINKKHRTITNKTIFRNDYYAVLKLRFVKNDDRTRTVLTVYDPQHRVACIHKFIADSNNLEIATSILDEIFYKYQKITTK